MSKIKNLFDYAKDLSRETEAWALAFRKRGETALYEGDPDRFIVIPNTARYWKADPFLITHQGKTYVFCEMYDRKCDKGVIGVARLKNNKCSAFRVCLDLPWHLSFPYVFQREGEFYMMPECGASGEIAVYKAVKFPFRWEKAYIVAVVPGVDTIPVPSEEKPDFYLTTVERNNRLVKFRSGSEAYETVYDNNYAGRCAGRIIRTEVGLIRPSQNDKDRYGNSLHFLLIDDSSFEGYREHEILHVLPPESQCGVNEISIKLCEPSSIRFAGIHTYNCSESYEIVDMVYYGECNRVIFWKKRKKFLEHLQKRL